MLAIIGGSGLTNLSNLDVRRRRVVRTPYGEPSGALTIGRLKGTEVVFLARHGYSHSIPPHLVNYRANIWALQSVGVKQIVSVASVGGILPELGPGAIAIPGQILDYTYGRAHTFFDGAGQPVTHVDFTEPYDRTLRAACLAAAGRAAESVHDGGIYATTQGPRLETAAEIDRIERDGGDMVGMTGMPEAVLARELGIAYAAIAVVANHAAGRASSASSIRLDDIGAVLQEAMARVRRILEALVDTVTERR
jgi:5'-methylthioadenosine phosphorylase